MMLVQNRAFSGMLCPQNTQNFIPGGGPLGVGACFFPRTVVGGAAGVGGTGDGLGSSGVGCTLRGARPFRLSITTATTITIAIAAARPPRIM